MNDLDRLKTRVTDAVDRIAEELWALALRIHANPELAFKEEKAAAWLTELLERQGCRVERGVGGLATAFRAEVPGAGDGPTIAVMAEYDALAGHRPRLRAQRHRDRGRGRGSRAGRRRQHPRAGTPPVSGPHRQSWAPPPRKGGAGKVKLMEAGVFRDVDAAMMIHPRCGTQVWRPTLGLMKAKVEYFGTAAHASSWPWRGVNALERGDRALQRARCDAPASPARRARSRGHHGRRPAGRTSSPSTRRPTSTCGRSTRPTCRSFAAGSKRRRRARRPPPAAGSRSRSTRRSTTRSSPTPRWRALRAEPRPHRLPRGSRRRSGRLRLHRRRQRESRGADDPSLRPHGARRRPRPLPRVRGAQRDAARPQRAWWPAPRRSP